MNQVLLGGASSAALKTLLQNLAEGKATAVTGLSEGQAASLSRTDEVESMGAFPAKDSCRFVGDVLVVKVGE